MSSYLLLDHCRLRVFFVIDWEAVIVARNIGGGGRRSGKSRGAHVHDQPSTLLRCK